VLGPCNLYSLRALLGGLCLIWKLRGSRPPPGACFDHFHLTPSISAVISSLRWGFVPCVESESWATASGGKRRSPMFERYAEKARRAIFIARYEVHRQQSRHGDPGLGSPSKTGETESRLRSHDRHSDRETGRLDERAGSSHQFRAAIPLGSCLTRFCGCRY
jgi:hypothetical protein